MTDGTNNPTTTTSTTKVGFLEIYPQGDQEIVITRAFQAARPLVFEALTKPEILRPWLLGPPGWSMVVCEVDLRVGGQYRYVWRKDGGPDMGMGGTFREIVAPERIVAVELFDEDWTGGETLVTTVLSEKDGKTTAAMTVRYSSTEARDAVLASPMASGLEAGYAGMDEVLTSGLCG
ncbi:MAG: SRPBCC family protein [Gemmataceae bacterium]